MVLFLFQVLNTLYGQGTCRLNRWQMTAFPNDSQCAPDGTRSQWRERPQMGQERLARDATDELLANGSQLSVLSFEFLSQNGKHAFDLHELPCQFPEFFLPQET